MTTFTRILPFLALGLAVACGNPDGTDSTDDHSDDHTDDDHTDDDPHGHGDNELITTVTLTFSPQGGGDDIVATFQDLNDNVSVDAITLAVGTTYDLSVDFLNELEDPAEEITEEVEDEAEEHQVFFLGDAVNGPANESTTAIVTHAYADMDANGNPIGLANTITADTAGTGELEIILRHMPEESGTAVKTATSAADVKSGGLSAIGGDNDVDADFDITVE